MKKYTKKLKKTKKNFKKIKGGMFSSPVAPAPLTREALLRPFVARAQADVAAAIAAAGGGAAGGGADPQAAVAAAIAAAAAGGVHPNLPQPYLAFINFNGTVRAQLDRDLRGSYDTVQEALDTLGEYVWDKTSFECISKMLNLYYNLETYALANCNSGQTGAAASFDRALFQTFPASVIVDRNDQLPHWQSFANSFIGRHVHVGRTTDSNQRTFIGDIKGDLIVFDEDTIPIPSHYVGGHAVQIKMIGTFSQFLNLFILEEDGTNEHAHCIESLNDKATVVGITDALNGDDACLTRPRSLAMYFVLYHLFYNLGKKCLDRICRAIDDHHQECLECTILFDAFFGMYESTPEDVKYQAAEGQVKGPKILLGVVQVDDGPLPINRDSLLKVRQFFRNVKHEGVNPDRAMVLCSMLEGKLIAAEGINIFRLIKQLQQELESVGGSWMTHISSSFKIYPANHPRPRNGFQTQPRNPKITARDLARYWRVKAQSALEVIIRTPYFDKARRLLEIKRSVMEEFNTTISELSALTSTSPQNQRAQLLLQLNSIPINGAEQTIKQAAKFAANRKGVKGVNAGSNNEGLRVSGPENSKKKRRPAQRIGEIDPLLPRIKATIEDISTGGNSSFNNQEQLILVKTDGVSDKYNMVELTDDETTKGPFDHNDCLIMYKEVRLQMIGKEWTLQNILDLLNKYLVDDIIEKNENDAPYSFQYRYSMAKVIFNIPPPS